MSWPKRLDLRGWTPKLEGCGETVTLVFQAYRNNKQRTGETFRGEVRVEADRMFVRRLCEAIAEMQANDQARINYELARLSKEVAPLTMKQQPKETI